MTLEQAGTTLIGILVLAAVVEALTEYLAEPIVGKFYKVFSYDREVPESIPILRYVAAAIGVGLCLVYNADLLAMGGLVANTPFVGSIVTGLLIGRGANFVNDFASKYLTKT